MSGSYPPELDKLVNAAAAAPAAAAAVAPGPLCPPSVTPSGGLDFVSADHRDQKRCRMQQLVTNSSGHDVDLFVWYGTHLTNFRVSDNTCDTVTPPQGKCTFNVSFAPMELHSPEARLRIVSRSDWKNIYEDKRVAYYNQVELSRKLSEAKDAVDTANNNVNEQQKKLKTSKDAKAKPALQFCEESPASGGKKGAQLIEACKNLRDANDKFKEIQDAFSSSIAKGKLTEEDVNKAANALRDKALAVIPLSGTANHWKYPLTRGVVGLDMSAVSSQTVKQAYFVDFDLLAPFKFPGTKSNEDALENRSWFWLNPRITSLPQATNFSALSTIDASGTFFTNFSNKGSVSDIAQGFDVNGGLEIALLKPRDGIPWWGEYVNAQARLGASFIVGAGISTPFSVDNTDVPSQVNQSICDAFKAPAGATVSGPSGLVCTFAAGGTNPVLTAPNPAFDPDEPDEPGDSSRTSLLISSPPNGRGSSAGIMQGSG